MTKLIFLGAPGAGKGTQAELLAKKLAIPHISTGEILRGAIANETPLGITAKSYVDNGDLVPDSLILNLVEERLNQSDTDKGWILDGFPRNVSQAIFLEELLDKLSQSCDYVVNLDVPDEILIERLLGRGRQDDNHETIANRLQVYRKQTQPLIDYYQEKNLLHQINGDRQMEEVSTSLYTVVTS